MWKKERGSGEGERGMGRRTTSSTQKKEKNHCKSNLKGILEKLLPSAEVRLLPQRLIPWQPEKKRGYEKEKRGKNITKTHFVGFEGFP